MTKQLSQIRADLKPGEVRGLNFDSAKFKNPVGIQELNCLGIGLDAALSGAVKEYFNTPKDSFGMDSAPLQTLPSISNAAQFFQYWAPEAVETVTQARTIDNLIGRTIAGSFEDEEIITTILERTGTARPYTDTANIPLASWNQNFEARSIVRYEAGLEIGYLEQMRASRMRIDDHKQKTDACAEALDIARNELGFYGYADGTNRTFGFLNDPSLPAYNSVAANAGGGQTEWSNKSFDEISSDIITAVQNLVTKMRGHFNPQKDAFVIALSLSSSQYLNVRNSLGTQSVLQWIKETYPAARIEAAPELDGANGGSNVFYLYAEKIKGKDVFKQYVVDVLRLIGIEKKAKVTLEDYANALAGVIVQYPIGVVRYSGI